MPKIIFLIFTLAILIRFLYFPENINFSYDQARDSFAALDILKGDLKVLGPPTTAGGNIFHGTLTYYILAPIYLLTNNNPEIAAGVFRLINALGVFLVFYIGKTIFQKEIGLIAALLFAVSFEQSQYSLFFGHPAPGVIGVLIYYLGLTLWFFDNKRWGFILALSGLGLAFQFEDANFVLSLTLLSYLFLFHEKFKSLDFRNFILSVLAFLLVVSTFIISEIKYHFRMSQSLFEIILKPSHIFNIENVFHLVPLIYLLFFVSFIIWLIRKKLTRNKGVFLLVWFLVGMIPQILNSGFTYYYSPGATVSLLIIGSFFIYQIYLKYKLLAVFLILVIILSNLSLITSRNYQGVSSDILIQPGLLTSSERAALDYIYTKASGKPFAVNALTVPLNVKTTWDYLFNWYGKDKYGYLPVWGGETANGFPGTLTVVTDRSRLPDTRFTILEPTIGIGQKQIDDFIRIENYFSKVIEEKSFGTIKVQVRERI